MREKRNGILLKGKNDGSGRCFVATERVSAGVTTEVIEYLVVDHFAEDAARRAACRAADETGDHGARDGSADGTDRSSEQADSCASFRTGESERDTAGRASDCTNGSASLACAVAGIDAVRTAFRARRHQARLGVGPIVILRSTRRNETWLERLIIVVLVQVRIVRGMRTVGMGGEVCVTHGRPLPAGPCHRTGAVRPT